RTTNIRSEPISSRPKREIRTEISPRFILIRNRSHHVAAHHNIILATISNSSSEIRVRVTLGDRVTRDNTIVRITPHHRWHYTEIPTRPSTHAQIINQSLIILNTRRKRIALRIRKPDIVPMHLNNCASHSIIIQILTDILSNRQPDISKPRAIIQPDRSRSKIKEECEILRRISRVRPLSTKSLIQLIQRKVLFAGTN